MVTSATSTGSININGVKEKSTDRGKAKIRRGKWKRLKEKRNVEPEEKRKSDCVGKRKEQEEFEDMDISSPKRHMSTNDNETAGLAQQASREK